MSKISDELRNWCDDTYMGSVDDLYSLADRIDSEMVELPKDRDGVPIHVGDPVFVFRSGDALSVSGILMKAGCVCVRVNQAGKADDWYTTPGAITHERPDSWERIADELEGLSVDSMVSDTNLLSSCALDLAKRIRRLAAKEDKRS